MSGNDRPDSWPPFDLNLVTCDMSGCPGHLVPGEVCVADPGEPRIQLRPSGERVNRTLPESIRMRDRLWCQALVLVLDTEDSAKVLQKFNAMRLD